MYGANKKMLNLLILKVLQEHSDGDHRLTQGEIIRLLHLQYGITCDRRSVRSNIQSLQDMGYDIATHGGCWLVERDFDDAELRILIDSVLFSRTLSTAQARRLVEKLGHLAIATFMRRWRTSRICPNSHMRTTSR